MIEELLRARGLPDLLTFADGTRVQTPAQWQRRRAEISEMLCREEYGHPPPAPVALQAEVLEEDAGFCAGKVTLSKVQLTAELSGGGAFSFPVCCAVPKAAQPCAAFVHINFRDAVPDKYMPTEEICDNGFAVFSFCYEDITADDDDFSAGLAVAAKRNSQGRTTAAGKIALWSWAAMRVMDFIQGLAFVDKNNIAVVGHSRLGKTALLTGALDERFAFVISNNSGCSGAALSRGKAGERIAAITQRFPYWFCEAYQKYAADEEKLPFDQHFLLALVAPRCVYAASAADDLWADPASEFLGCAAAGEAWALLGKRGLVHSGRLPQAGEKMHEGSVGYHLRPGRHYLSRYDWACFMDFMNKHRVMP